MTRALRWCTLLVLVLALQGGQVLAAESADCQVRAYFSSPLRNQVIEQEIITALGAARDTLLIAMYSFTDDQLGEAVIAAWDRGVRVWILLDDGQDSAAGGREWPKLVEAGIPVALEKLSGLLHHKFAVIDGRVTITGSYNWSDAADTSNFENVVILECPEIASQFAAEFWWIAQTIGTGWTRPD